ncbi:MAG: SpoIVB peptidase [Lachnospiraceae bacterium]|nr:SpoIVB peptidase [Lachnospiraceae bacterium]MCI9560249.1 SpoIVB peptidase [Lachnospiraceae bacterium]NBH16984.1 SpoIVB peptidase [Clostridiaceae bacterium]
MAGKKGKKSLFGRFLIWTFWLGLFMSVGFTWYYVERRIPNHLSVVVKEKEEFDFSLPFDVTLLSESEEVVLGNQSDIPSDEIRLKVDEPFSLYAKNLGSYRLGLKLFGRFQFKEIQLDVVDTHYAIPCGIPVGIYLKSNGVLVIGTGRIQCQNGEEVEPAYGVLQSGDYIEAINGEPLRDKEALISNLNHSGGQEALLRVRRNGEEMEIRMNPVQASDGNYKLGAWVRDDTQGIGTMTYVDTNGNFGALGHGISDSDTGEVVEIKEGALYETEIMGIEKGSAGNPGVMAGVIYYGPGSRLGTIEANTKVGIFGKVNEKLQRSLHGEAVEIGYRQDVKKGQAWVRSDVSGEVRDYEIEIQRVDYNPIQENKSLVIRVVDEELLRLTGGIVQGMSGSPILQDGKLVGAVTHVFVQDSTRGYGIFVEDMMRH